MRSRIVIAGAGFAGVWSALSAKRLIKLHAKEDIEVVLIAPEPSLVIRPRLYEANPASMTHHLGALFADAGIEFIQGTVEMIDTDKQTVNVRVNSGSESKSAVSYDRLILAVGSTVVRPPSVVGLAQHAFDIDSLSSATKLDSHLKSLASLPSSPARDTIVVCGAGFTGIELATELPSRFPTSRVILVGSANELAPDLGQGSRSVATAALKNLGVEIKLGSAVTAIDAQSVTLASGERIETMTTVWTAGMKANPLTNQIPRAKKDALSRLHVAQDLRVPSNPHVFATGDTAHALADTNGGHHALMSCQHALVLGRISGHNAAADLLDQPTLPYSQPAYNCCLDLGAYGAVISNGWERELKLEGDLAKRVKNYINQQLIYPPQSVEEAMTAADPVTPDSDQLFEQILAVV